MWNDNMHGFFAKDKFSIDSKERKKCSVVKKKGNTNAKRDDTKNF